MAPAESICSQVVTVASVQARPVIDGRLDEPAWREAPEHRLQYTYAGDKAIQAGTTFRLLHDGEALILGIVCQEPSIAELKRDAHESHAVYDDDCVEIFIDPSGQGELYFQYMVNSLGTIDRYVRTREGVRMLEQPTPGLTAKGQVGADNWRIEVRIPFVDLLGVDAALAAPPPAGGRAWGFNVVRNRHAGRSEMSSFMNQRSDWFNTELYARLAGLPSDFQQYRWAVRQGLGVRTERGEQGVRLAGEFAVENRTGKAESIMIAGGLTDASGAQTALAPMPQISIEAGAGASAPFSAALPGPGEYRLFAVLRRASDRTPVRVVARKVSVAASALRIVLERPSYRSAIFHTMDVKELALRVVRQHAVEWDRLRVALCDARERRVAHLEVRGAARDETPVALPIPKLGPGTYRIVAEAFLGEQAVDRAGTPLHVYGPCDFEVRVNERANIVVNGQEVFLVGFFGGHSYLDKVVDGAINYAACYTFIPELHFDDFYANAEIMTTSYPSPYMYYYQEKGGPERLQPLRAEKKKEFEEFARKWRNQEGVLGWYLADEPSPGRHAKEFLRDVYAAMRRGDPFHPCFISFNTPDLIDYYAGSFDVMGTHCYPGYGPRGMIRPMTMVADYVEGMRKASRGKIPFIFAPQLLLFGEPACPIPFREERCMTHLALIHGAKGIYWAYADDACHGHELRFGMPYLVREVKSLERFVLAPDVATLELKQPETNPVHCLAKTYDDCLTVLLANTSVDAVDYSFAVPQRFAGVREFRTVSEGRGLPVEDGVVRDRLGPYAVRILTTDARHPELATLDSIRAVLDREHQRLMQSGNLCYMGRGTTADSNGIKRYNYSMISGYFDRRRGWGFREFEGTWLKVTFATPETVGRVVLYSPDTGNVLYKHYSEKKMGSVLCDYTLSLQVDGKWIEVQGEPRERIVERTVRPGEFVYPLHYKHVERTHVLDPPVAKVTAVKLLKRTKSGMITAIMAYEQ